MSILRAARDIEDRTGQESFDPQAHAILNWHYYDEIHHEQSINYCTLFLKSFLYEKGGLNREGTY